MQEVQPCLYLILPYFSVHRPSRKRFIVIPLISLMISRNEKTRWYLLGENIRYCEKPGKLTYITRCVCVWVGEPSGECAWRLRSRNGGRRRHESCARCMCGHALSASSNMPAGCYNKKFKCLSTAGFDTLRSDIRHR